jgi:hypothetical protein
MASNSLQNNIFSGISKCSYNRSKFTSTNNRNIQKKKEIEPKVEPPSNIVEKRRCGNTVNCIFTGSFFVNSIYVPSKTRISIPINITIYGNTKLVDTLILYPSVDLQSSLMYAGHDILSEDTIIIYLYNNTCEDIHDDIERKWKYIAFIF